MPIDPRNPPLLAWAMAAGRGDSIKIFKSKEE